jgi:hypothetical protein
MNSLRARRQVETRAGQVIQPTKDKADERTHTLKGCVRVRVPIDVRPSPFDFSLRNGIFRPGFAARETPNVVVASIGVTPFVRSGLTQDKSQRASRAKRGIPSVARDEWSSAPDSATREKMEGDGSSVGQVRLLLRS